MNSLLKKAWKRALLTVGVVTCGTERWDVKTGTDSNVGMVTMTPLPTTVAELVAFPAPPSDPPTRVAGGPEYQVYTITATIVACKQEVDSDYHLALSDGQGHTMIAESACPQCAANSPWLPQITASRAAIDATIHNITGSYQELNLTATITGVGFFDRIHGQRGVAPNGIELHPILNITFQGAP